MKSKPIANWTTPSEYPKWNSTSLLRFAWEFLRRNPEYQKDWADYIGICRGIIPHFDPHVELSADDYDTLENHPDYARCDPPRLAGENERAWLDRVGGGAWMPLHSWYAKRWGLVHDFPDPFYAYEKLPLGLSLTIGFKNSPGACVVTEHWEGFKETRFLSTRTKLALAFDFSLPIKPQLDVAKRYLENHQRWLIKNGVVEAVPNKIPRKEWVTYLRLLDADAVNAKPKKMAELLYKDTENSYPDYGGSKTASAALETAKIWRDSGYSLIPTMKKIPCKN